MNSEPKNDDGVIFHAGFPNPAGDTRQKLSLDQLLTPNTASSFFMKIKGDNWNSIGIFNNDIAVIDKSLTPRKQDLVVIWDTDSFLIETLANLPKNSEPWGVITATIHRFRS